MYKTVITSAALMASAVLAQNVGLARVLNGCNYEVYLSNVPSANGGYDSIDKVLSPNETYEQTFTELSNGNGWSIKLSKTADLANILQYEYTYHPGEPIWYDLSCVNGNPWDGNWEISAEGETGCTPKNSYYRYSTDDAFGMQDCPVDSDITVTLCSGEEQNDGIVASVSSVAAASSSAAPVASSSEAAPSSTYVPEPASSYVAPSSSAPHSWAHHNHQVSEAAATPTTFAVVTTAAPGITVTEIATVIVTEIATATHYAREEHMHHHAARHPHVRA